MGPDAAAVIHPTGVAPDPWAPWRAWLDVAIRREIDRLRLRYELSLDEFRGLYVSDEQVDRLLVSREDHAAVNLPPVPGAVWDTRIGDLADGFDLEPRDATAVVVALAPELDRKYETLFAYLNDDVTRRFATVDLCRRLTGGGPGWMDADARVFVEGLMEGVRQPPAAWGSAAVVVRDPVRRYLLGGTEIPVPAAEPVGEEERRVARALGSGDLACLVISGGAEDEAPAAARALAADQRRALIEVRVDEGAERAHDDLLTARLHRAWAYLPLHTLETEGCAPSVGVLLRTSARTRVPTVVGVAREARWRAVLQATDHDVLTLEPPEHAERIALWHGALRARGVRAADDDVDSVAGLFTLYPGQIRRAAGHAHRAGDGHADRAILSRSARAQCATALEELADRVPLVHGWDDLVLPAPTLRRVREFAGAVRSRTKVFHDWGFLRPAGGTPSLRALFSGMSGTGKTMSAAVVARDLGLDLYRIDLSQVVSKFIGETEKNLERIFGAAEGSNAILFFDEADALFGKRSEVKDAHDRYANVEIAFLLQRMETHDGVMILATNLAKNLDEAFSRRIHFAIEFPPPDEEQRERLWRTLLPPAAPARALDHRFLARQFPLTGGEIRNVALDAAFLAAHESDVIAMEHLVRAVARQRRKQGKLPTPSEFRHYLTVVHKEGA